MQDSFVFFGTPYVARDTLARLVERGFTPSLVVTSPDAPRGRGMVMTPCETKEWAAAHDLPVFSPEKLDKDAAAAILEGGPSFAVVVAYGKLLPEKLINAFPKGVVNVHYSLLPKYRGASPVEAALRNGDAATGVSLQKMVREMDAGDILAQKEEAILPDDTTKTLRARLIEEGARLLADLMPRMADGSAVGTPQDHAAATFARKIEKGAGELDLAADAKENWNKYRAYAENPGTYFFMDKGGKRVRVKIKTAEWRDGRFVPLRVVPEGKTETDYANIAA